MFELKAFLKLITSFFVLDCYSRLFALLFAHLGRSSAVVQLDMSNLQVNENIMMFFVLSQLSVDREQDHRL